MNTTTLSGALFTSMVKFGAISLYNNRETVNDLNVFPIPDGDTGDNMYMTLQSGATSTDQSEAHTLSSASQSISKGMLLGARGNSGVILSRIFAGIAQGFASCDCADIHVVGNAFAEGIKQAYAAVSVPVEGTILTVYREAVEYANSHITDNSTLEDYFNDLCAELRNSLSRTPELLSVLKEAGVVDSGGAGFVYIADGMKKALSGEALPADGSQMNGTNTKKAVDLSLFGEDSVMEFGYCTEFLLQLTNSKTDIKSFDIDAFTSYLTSVGESVVSFLEGSIVKVHVHTMTPGEILNYCQQYGEFLTVKIENMTLQHSETQAKDTDTENSDGEPLVTRIKTRKKYAVVAVAGGEGISNTFRELGADCIVSGGQCMNPSAEDFLRAFDEANADTIFVLPNNKNILLTAEQASELYTSSVVKVIKSKTIGDGYSALSMFDTSSDDPDTIVALAEEAMEGVVTGEVSRAVRHSVTGGVAVNEGDYIGFVGSTIVSCTDNSVSAAAELAEKESAGSRDVVIIICGSNASVDDADRLYSLLSSKYKKTEFIMLDGGQAIYDFILIFE